MKRKLSIVIFFSLIIASFYLFNYSMSVMFGNKYIDMSGNGRYSLSPLTKKIISELNGKQTVKIYISPQIATDFPQTGEYVKYVTEQIKQYSKISNKKIENEIIEIEPYSRQEQEAEQYGLKDFLSKDGKISLYFGAVITNEEGNHITIPNFVEMRRPYLEYDLTSAIYQLSQSQKLQKIGIIAPDMNLKLTKEGEIDTDNNLNIFNQLKDKFRLIPISDYAVQISADINTVVLINPNGGLSKIGQYALDQFVLRGGNLIVFVDAVDEKNGKQNDGSGINNILNNWGINFSSDKTIGSKNNAIQIITNGKSFPYAAWMNLTPNNFNQENVLTKGINSISLRAPAAIEQYKTKAEEFRFTPLISISEGSGVIDSSIAKQSYKELAAADFKETNKEYVIAAMVEGKFRSAFLENIMKGTKYEKQMLSYLPRAMKAGRIIVMGDIDFLYDTTWSDNSYKQKNPVYGIVPWSENGFLFEKILNKLTNKEELSEFSVQPILPHQSLGEKFKTEAEKKETGVKEEKQKELKELINQAEKINYQDYSLGNVQYINKLQEKITAAEKAIRQIDYQTMTDYRKKVNIFMGISALIMVLYAAIIFLRFKHNLKLRRRYMEKIDE